MYANIGPAKKDIVVAKSTINMNLLPARYNTSNEMIEIMMSVPLYDFAKGVGASAALLRVKICETVRG